MKNIVDYLYKNITTICVLGLIMGLTACDSGEVLESADNPIVEGYLVADHPITIHIKKEIPYSEQSISTEEPLDGLNVTITGGGNTYHLKNNGDGYYSDSTVSLKVGISYTMNFTYNGKVVTATTVIPSRPTNFASDQTSIYLTQVDLSSGGMPTPGMGGGETRVNLSWTNDNSDYYFVVVENIETDPEAVIILPSTTTIPADARRFRNQPVQGTESSINPNQFQYFGQHHIILMHVNPDYAALYKSTGSTSQNISTPPTSITNGFGIFTGVNADTLNFEVKKR